MNPYTGTDDELKLKLIISDDNKIGLQDKAGNIVVEPIYDYDKAVMGSYYIDPEHWDNYYLYRFRLGYMIFKLGEKICVYNYKGELVEQLTDDNKKKNKIIDKYYFEADDKLTKLRLKSLYPSEY